MSDIYHSKYNGDIYVPERIDFCILGKDEILKSSAILDEAGITKIENPNQGVPVDEGVNDTHMGTTSNLYNCATCGSDQKVCPGHIGHITLSEPLFNMAYINMAKTLLQIICFKCQSLMISPAKQEEIKLFLSSRSPESRFEYLKQATKSTTNCHVCGTLAQKITLNKKHADALILAKPIIKGEKETDDDNSKQQNMTARSVYDIFRGVSEDIRRLIGFDPRKSKPEDMIINVFPVPPPAIRPTSRGAHSGGNAMEDDLTVQLLGLVKINEQLKDLKGSNIADNRNKHKELKLLLQVNAGNLYNNRLFSNIKTTSKNTKEFKSISTRVTSKKGRVRGNLMGKRVNDTGRTVVSSDSNISINDVGVPLLLAMQLTYDEVVTPVNFQRLKAFVENGPLTYPGANYVLKDVADANGNVKKKQYNLSVVKINIEIGDIVKRHLINGDMLIFNRQPSLHKMSLMGHHVNVIPNKNLMTFRVNVNVTGPYGADFDGDEMNIHVPSSPQSIVEVALICNAGLRFVSPTNSNVGINVKQDTLMGSFVQIKDKFTINYNDAMNILMTTTMTRTTAGVEKLNLKKQPITGSELYSYMIPTEVNVGSEEKWSILNGVVQKNANMNADLLSLIIKETWTIHKSRATINLMDDMQKSVLSYLQRRGYTMGLRDLIISDKTRVTIRKMLEAKRTKIMNDITTYENDPFVMSEDAYEISTKSELSAYQGDLEQCVMNALDESSCFLNAIRSKSSGTSMNAGQIAACIGQVIVDGRRIDMKFNGRTLPCFFKGDNSPEARGFCFNSFWKGLISSEFFFQVIAGREGLITTAIKTAETGYTQRKITKIMEDIVACYDGTVRDANGRIVLFVYGDNNVNTENQIEQELTLLTLDDEQLAERHRLSDKDIKGLASSYDRKMDDALFKRLKTMRDKIRSGQSYFKVKDIETKISYMMPINLVQQISQIKNRQERKTTSIVDPVYALESIKELLQSNELRIIKRNNDPLTLPFKERDDTTCKLIMRAYLYDMLSPKRCIFHKFSKNEFDELIKYVKSACLTAMIEPGEMVGLVGANSIGEPVTQSNLKFFQKAGTGKAVSAGLPRTLEILSVTKEIKTPFARLIFDESHGMVKDDVDRIASYLRTTTLQDLIDNIQIIYDPHPSSKTSTNKMDKVGEPFCTESGCASEIDTLPWVIRLTMSRSKLIDRGVTLLDIKSNFNSNWINRFDTKVYGKENKKVIERITQAAILSNSDNSDTPIIHVRIDGSEYTFDLIIQFMEMILNKYKIKGISGIVDINRIYEESVVYYNDDGKKAVKKIWAIETDGINLPKISNINGIDMSQTVCNDLWVIYRRYGIEAFISQYIKELTISLDSSSGFANYQHIELLVNMISKGGVPIPVNRFGSDRLDPDPLAKASFEEVMEHLTNAAIFGKSDYMRSVSSRVMAGSLIKGGTTLCSLRLDVDKIMAADLVAPGDKEIEIKESSLADRLKKRK